MSPVKVFWDRYNFSEKSMRMELRSGCQGTVAPLLVGSDLLCVTVRWCKSRQHLFCSDGKSWGKCHLGVVMGEGELYLLFFSPFSMGKPEQWEWKKVRRGGMFKIQLKGEPTQSKTLGIRRVWTAKFYAQIQKNLLPPPWKGTRRIVYGEVSSSSSNKS